MGVRIRVRARVWERVGVRAALSCLVHELQEQDCVLQVFLTRKGKGSERISLGDLGAELSRSAV